MDICLYRDPKWARKYIIYQLLSIYLAFDDLYAILIRLLLILWILTERHHQALVDWPELASLRHVEKQLITKSIKGAKRARLDELDHQRGINNVYPPQFVEEVLRPFLDEPPEGKEVEEARVDICNGIRAVVIIMEMMEFFDDVLLNIVPEL